MMTGPIMTWSKTRGMALILSTAVLAGCGNVSDMVGNIFSSDDSSPPPQTAQAAAPAPATTTPPSTAAAAAPAEAAPVIDFPSAPLPRYAPGDTFTYVEGGQTVREQVLTTTPDKVVWTNDSGTVWTTTYDVSSPVLSWSGDPELGRGKQEIEGGTSNLFPMNKGSAVDYTVVGQAERRPDGWRVRHSCKVVDGVPLDVQAGRFFTYEIVCQRPDHIETLFYAPATQTYARRIRAFDTLTVTRDLAQFNFATARPIEDMSPFQTALAMLDGETMPKAVAKPMAKKEPDPETMEALAQRVSRLENKIDRIVTAMEKGEKLMMDGDGEAMAAKEGKKSADTMKAKPQSGTYGIHLASYRAEKAAERGWKVLSDKFKSELGGLDYTLVKFKPRTGRGDFFRLVVGSFADKKAADAACRPLRTKRQYCQALKI